MKQRLDQALVQAGLAHSRSQGESYIRLGEVTVNKNVVAKPGFLVSEQDVIKIEAKERYVSRAALKLASVAEKLHLDFRDKVVLDVGSSTGGFTDYTLRHGAKKVIAVDVGTDQLHQRLRSDGRIELHEKTDIRDVRLRRKAVSDVHQVAHEKRHTAYRVLLDALPDIILIDVSFISLRSVLPHIALLCGPNTQVIAMVKPQFEAGQSGQKHKGVIKNDAIRRQILKEFEAWVQNLFAIKAKADSDVTGAKGNRERFYLLTPLTPNRSHSAVN